MRVCIRRLEMSRGAMQNMGFLKTWPLSRADGIYTGVRGSGFGRARQSLGVVPMRWTTLSTRDVLAMKNPIIRAIWRGTIKILSKQARKRWLRSLSLLISSKSNGRY